MCKPCWILLVAAVAGVFAPRLSAQDIITNVATTITTQPPSGYTQADTGSLTFENAVNQLTGFTTSTGTYAVAGAADNALVQRNGTPYQSSVWYDDGTGSDLIGVHQNDYGAMLASNNFYEGSDNTFANGTSAQAGNIERLDFTYNAPLSNLSTLAFAVFDRGAVGVHDAFTIALVTGVSSNGTPTSYGAALKVAGNWGGSTNVLPTANYNLFRYNSSASAPNVISAANSTSETGSQGVGGLVINLSAFGALAPGTQIFGYSLMGYDVDISNLNNLLDVSNTAVYPSNTDGTTGGGGIDLAAVNGLDIQEVPEPGTGALLLAGAAGLVVARRRGRMAGGGSKAARGL